MLFRSNYAEVIDSYDNLAIEMENTLNLENTEQAIAELEAYVINHKEAFENLATNHEALENGLLFQWASFSDGRHIEGTAAKYIIDNKDKFRNRDVKDLFQRIGYFHKQE